MHDLVVAVIVLGIVAVFAGVGWLCTSWMTPPRGSTPSRPWRASRGVPIRPTSAPVPTAAAREPKSSPVAAMSDGLFVIAVIVLCAVFFGLGWSCKAFQVERAEFAAEEKRDAEWDERRRGLESIDAPPPVPCDAPNGPPEDFRD